jgi:hypothetical protein
MSHTLAILIGVIVGLSVGYVAGRLPIAPVFQSITAGMVAMFLAAICAAIVWVMRPPLDAAVVAVSFGIRENVMLLAAVLLTTIVAHLVMGWLSGLVHPALATHRAVAMGVVGALVSAVGSVSGFAGAHPLK